MTETDTKTEGSIHPVALIDFRWSLWQDATPEETKAFHETGFQRLKDLFLEKQDRYIFQLEQGEDTGVFHYQGHAGLKTRTRTKQLAIRLNEHFKGISIRPCSNKGKEALENYCMKDTTRVAGPWSDRPIPKRKHLEVLKHPYPWQSYILNYIAEEPNDREILWIVDKKGGAGKTQLTKCLIDKFKAQFIGYGKASDLLYIAAENPGQPIYAFDLTRSKPKDVGENDLYAALEQIKNGLICNTKYKGNTKIFDPPHVIIFSNQEPNLEAMSKDRWKVVFIENNEIQDKNKKPKTIDEEMEALVLEAEEAAARG